LCARLDTREHVYMTTTIRLTQYATAAVRLQDPPGELERVLDGLGGVASWPAGELLVGLADGDDAAAVRISAGVALIATTDFFTPVVDDPYDWGRIAAANALSDVYAMGGRPVVALNLLCWPRELLPLDLSARCCAAAWTSRTPPTATWPAGTASTTRNPSTAWRSPASPTRTGCCATTPAGRPAALADQAAGHRVLNSRHKATGEVFPHAVDTMATLNRDAAVAALAAGIVSATDVTGFGLLGHVFKLARASGVTAIIDAAAVPYLDGARQALRDGYVSGGTRRNLDWVRPRTDLSTVDESEALLLADAQTSGGLLLVGEIPGAPVIGELVPAGPHTVVVRG